MREITSDGGLYGSFARQANKTPWRIHTREHTCKMLIRASERFRTDFARGNVSAVRCGGGCDASVRLPAGFVGEKGYSEKV